MKTSTGDSIKDPSQPMKVLIVAAEESSASYAHSLLSLWKQEGRAVKAFGIGNNAMETLGFERLGRSEELAVMGLGEIISHWPVIKKAFYALVERVQEDPPDMILLMDYPEFNLRLAQKLKASGVPIVYYISPQIWAWRTYRVKKIRRLVDLMLVIFPFEKQFYDKHQVPCEFVGHPLMDQLGEKLPTSSRVQELRGQLLGDHKHLLGLMPGSRRSEIKHNLKSQLETAQRVVAKDSSVQPVLLVAPSLDMNTLREQAQELDYQGEFLQLEPFHMISCMDTILCASGTATLMVGLCKKPMVVMYKMKPRTAFFARYLVRHIPYFSMVNLVLEQEAVPEFFQREADPETLSESLLQLITDHNQARTLQLQSLSQLSESLGKGAGIRRLNGALLKFLGHQ